MLVTVGASRASRGILLVFAAVAFAFSRAWLWLPGAGTLALAFAACLPRRQIRLVGAATGALGVQVVLRWPSVGFHGLTAAVAAVAVTLVLLSGWRGAARGARRVARIGVGVSAVVLLILAVPVVISALLVSHRLEHGVSLAKASVSSFEDGRSNQAKSVIGEAASDLHAAHKTLSAWWNLGGYLVPVLAQQERALAGGAKAGADLTATVYRQAGAFDVSGLRISGGRLDVNRLEQLQHPTVLVDDAVIAAQSEMLHIRSPWLVSALESRLGSFDKQMTRFRSDADLAVLAAKDGPALLGADGVRHYFVAFMTPAETRGLGGFLGTYGLLTVDDGSIKLTASGRPNQLTAIPSASRHLTGPPSYLARYGAFDPQNNFEDLTYAPDLPAVGDVISQLYPQVGGVHLDGVLVLDPDALAALLQLTGPVDVPGLGQLDAANAGPILLRQQYLDQSLSANQRHDYLQNALSVGFHELTHGSLPAPRTIGEDLGPVVKQGRLLFWSSDQADTALLQRLGLYGAFPSRQDGDLLAVTDANAANDKLDAYLDQRVVDDVLYNRFSGQVTSKVTIDLHNSGTAQMPSYVSGSYAGSGLPAGTDQIWLSIYTPLSLTSVTVDGKAASFSGPTKEDGEEVYSGFVDIPQQSTTTIVADLTGRVLPGAYVFTTRLQPLANPQQFSVAVHGPGMAAATWKAGVDQVERHRWATSKP